LDPDRCFDPSCHARPNDPHRRRPSSRAITRARTRQSRTPRDRSSNPRSRRPRTRTAARTLPGPVISAVVSIPVALGSSAGTFSMFGSHSSSFARVRSLLASSPCRGRTLHRRLSHPSHQPFIACSHPGPIFGLARQTYLLASLPPRKEAPQGASPLPTRRTDAGPTLHRIRVHDVESDLIVASAAGAVVDRQHDRHRFAIAPVALRSVVDRLQGVRPLQPPLARRPREAHR
jgi:hypothetical protein